MHYFKFFIPLFFFQFTGFLNQSAELEAESQRLIRMTQEVILSINVDYQLSTALNMTKEKNCRLLVIV